MSIESDKHFAVKNTTHGCGFFASEEAALDQIRRCLTVPEGFRTFKVGKGCHPCCREELPDPNRLDIITCSYGTLGGLIDHKVKVIYLPDVTKI